MREPARSAGSEYGFALAQAAQIRVSSRSVNTQNMSRPPLSPLAPAGLVCLAGNLKFAYYLARPNRHLHRDRFRLWPTLLAATST